MEYGDSGFSKPSAPFQNNSNACTVQFSEHSNLTQTSQKSCSCEICSHNYSEMSNVMPPAYGNAVNFEPVQTSNPGGYFDSDHSSMPNGYAKVTWVEYAEIEDKTVHRIYKQLVNSGMAFGAQRWLADLTRQCERLASLMASSISRGTEKCDEASSEDDKRFLCKHQAHQLTWTTLPSGDSVRITTWKHTEPGLPSGVVVSGATSLWLPVPISEG